MVTINITKYQARQALNSYHYANDDLMGKSIAYLEDECKFNSQLTNIRKIDDKFHYIRNTKGTTYDFTIDTDTMTLSQVCTINNETVFIPSLKVFLGDLSVEEQKYGLQHLYLDSIEKYLSKRTGIPIKLYSELKQTKQGNWVLNLFSENLIDKTGICKAMLKEIHIECTGIGYSIDYDKTGEQYLGIPAIYFQYEHHAGGHNGYEIGRVRWNEDKETFEGYNYDTEKFEVI